MKDSERFTEEAEKNLVYAGENRCALRSIAFAILALAATLKENKEENKQKG